MQNNIKSTKKGINGPNIDIEHFTKNKGIQGMEVLMKIRECAKGQLLGWEDIVRGRNYSTSARCFTKKGTLIKLSA